MTIRELATTFTFLFCASVAYAQEPSISWAANSPSVLPGPRIFAHGSYVIPAGGGGVFWTMKEIKIEYRLVPNQGYTSVKAIVDGVTKTWHYTSNIVPSGNYYVSGRMILNKYTGGMPPTVEEKVYNLKEKFLVVP
jgi:hypothetical protein